MTSHLSRLFTPAQLVLFVASAGYLWFRWYAGGNDSEPRDLKTARFFAVLNLAAAFVGIILLLYWK